MSRLAKVGLALLLLALLAYGARGWWAGRAGSAAQRTAAPAAGGAASAPPIELAASDLAMARRSELVSVLAVSGGLRAVNSAVVRAKVAAEVREVAVREGDRVAAGQVIVRLDDTEYQWRLRQAEDQAAAAKSQLDLAERTLANNKALVDQGFISRTALDTSLMSAEGARASLQAARAAAEIARKAVNDSVLRAPLAGLVSQRLVQPGERVGVDARLVEIVDLSRVELEAAVAPEDVAGVRIGQTARLTVDGLSETLPATVARINPSTQAGTRAVMVYLSLQGHPALRQGLFARGGIETQRRTALVVPVSAVRMDQASPYVLVAESGRVRQQAVTPGPRGEVQQDKDVEAVFEIAQGLAEGSLVIRGTAGALRDGAAIKLPTSPAAASTVAAASAASQAAAAR